MDPEYLTSASQIKNFDDSDGREGCQRKWFFKSVLRLPEPSSDAAALGIEVDEDQLQPYLTRGRPFELGRDSRSGEIAASLLPYLPTPKYPGLKCQKEIFLPSHRGPYAYTGFIDLYLPQGGMPGVEGVTVGDFKTTSNFRYALNESALRIDVQGVLYGMFGMVQTRAPELNLAWLYARTTGKPVALRTVTAVNAPHLIEQFERIEGVTERMWGLMKKARELEDKAESIVNALPPNTAVCGKFGGCPYAHKCNLGPVDAYDGVMGVKDAMPDISTDELLARLNRRKAAAAPPVEVVAEAPEVAPVAVLAPTTITDDLGRTRPVNVGINPPEKVIEADPVGIAVVAPTPIDVKEDAPKAKRGRPPGSKNKKTSEEVVLAKLAKTAEASAALVASVPSLVDEIPPPPLVPTLPPPEGLNEDEDYYPEQVTYVYGQETYAPVPFQSFHIGPFTLSTWVRRGETRGEALRRLSNEAYAFATEERANRFEAFKRACVRQGVQQ